MKRRTVGLVTILVVMVVGGLFFASPFYPLYNATRIITHHTPELVKEARSIELLTTNTGNLNPGNYPPIIRQMKPMYVSTPPQYGGGVQVMLTGGFYHSGIVIVTDTTNFDPNAIPFNAKQINEFVYMFKESGW